MKVGLGVYFYYTDATGVSFYVCLHVRYESRDYYTSQKKNVNLGSVLLYDV